MARKKKTEVSEVANIEMASVEPVIEEKVETTNEVVEEAPATTNVSTEVVNKTFKSSIDVASFNSANKIAKSSDTVEVESSNSSNDMIETPVEVSNVVENDYIMPSKTFDKEANAKIMIKKYTVRTAFSMNMKRTAIKQTLTLDEIIRIALIYKNKFVGFISTLDLDSVVDILNTREILFEYHILTKKDIDFIISRLKSNSEFSMRFPFRDD